jgi:hypothetical protein
MGFGFIDLRLSFSERTPTAPIQARLNDLRPALEAMPKIMREGEGSIADQFARQATLEANGRVRNWPRTRAFGTDKPGSAGLLRSGKYVAAWLGKGAGSYTAITSNSVAIGVSPAMFPQEVVFQKDGPTRISVTRKMRGYLAAAKGVHLRATTTSLTLEPRAFRANPVMVRRARQVALNYVINGTPTEYRTR